MITDVMEVEELSFLLSFFIPLEVTFSSNVTDIKEETLGRAIQDQLNLLRRWRFKCDMVNTDTQSLLVALKDKFPGIIFDITGAGDYLTKLDIKIRQVK